MALTSTSTIRDAQAQYRNSLRYDIDGSAAMAGDLIEACRFLREAKVASASAFSGDNFSTTPAELSAVEAKATRWLQSQPGRGKPGYVHPDFSDFR